MAGANLDDEGDVNGSRRKVVFLMCFFHMMKGVRDNRSKLKINDHYGEVLRDLRALHIVPHPCEDAFEYFLSLFYKKWTDLDELELPLSEWMRVQEGHGGILIEILREEKE